MHRRMRYERRRREIAIRPPAKKNTQGEIAEVGYEEREGRPSNSKMSGIGKRKKHVLSTVEITRSEEARNAPKRLQQAFFSRSEKAITGC